MFPTQTGDVEGQAPPMPTGSLQRSYVSRARIHPPKKDVHPPKKDVLLVPVLQQSSLRSWGCSTGRSSPPQASCLSHTLPVSAPARDVRASWHAVQFFFYRRQQTDTINFAQRPAEKRPSFRVADIFFLFLSSADVVCSSLLLLLLARPPPKTLLHPGSSPPSCLSWPLVLHWTRQPQATTVICIANSSYCSIQRQVPYRVHHIPPFCYFER